MKTLSKGIFVLSALGLSASAFAAEPLKVYGKANLSLQYVDAVETATDLKSNSSRFGVKGEVELDNGLTAIYQAEFGVDFADESKEKNVTARNQFVGLKGEFGQVRLGRMDTALKLAQGKVDLFNDYNADIKRLFEGDNRESDSVTYISPSFSGFAFGATYITHDENDTAEADSAGVSASVMYGDAKLKKSNLYAAIALDSDVDNHDVIRAVYNQKFGAFKLGALVQREESADGTGKADTGVMVNGAYFAGKLTYKLQYQTFDDKTNDQTLDTVSVGVDYKLGSATKLFTWYTSEEKGGDKNTLAVGIEHKF
ncbi:porin [Catenovulum agarivorans DS-2]|uniref:Porin n=1 Tax=Catenovulum agarivorans DS-2 TaxID=1328313 RepID=W7QNN1_9ALTE|nr:porin [Catenovulum agarivorans]EWH09538.1 porin [Catenovulum agarivorans DS-2]